MPPYSVLSPAFLVSTLLLLTQFSKVTLAQAQLVAEAPQSSWMMAQSPSLAQAQPSFQDAPPPPWAIGLNLSAEQRSRLQTIHQTARSEGESLHQTLSTAEQKLRSLLQSDASIELLRQQNQQVQRLREQVDNHLFDALLAERQVLTPDQLATLIRQIREHQ